MNLEEALDLADSRFMEQCVKLSTMVEDKTVSNTAATTIFQTMYRRHKRLKKIAERMWHE